MMRLKQILPLAATILFLLLAVIIGLGYVLSGPEKSIPQLIESGTLPNHARAPTGTADRLRIMTLNMAHGRGNGILRVVVSEERARRNLAAIAELIKQASPQLVALQEADETAFISGGFNHIRLLTRLADMQEGVLGNHVSGPRLAYGTAVISILPLHNPLSRTFAPSPPSLTKGFTVVSAPWPGPSFSAVTIVSVHFDFLLSSTRKRQADTLAEFLSNRSKPIIIAGDFNSSWSGADSVVRYLMQRLALTTWQPETNHEATFPASGRRIDWILISSDLKFSSYRVMPRIVSDHLAVLAELAPAENKQVHP